jgi:hypothetical protein
MTIDTRHRAPVMTERAAHLITLLGQADDYRDPCPGRGHITGLDHALRLALMMEQRTPDPQLHLAAIVHDLARPLNDVHHGEVMAEIIRDRVHPAVYYLLRTHGDYQHAVVHGLPYPKQPANVLQECQPHSLPKLALMFAACEAMTIDPEWEQLEPSPWNYARARDLILQQLGD